MISPRDRPTGKRRLETAEVPIQPSIQERISNFVWSRPGSIGVVCLTLMLAWPLSLSKSWTIPVASVAVYFALRVHRQARRLAALHLSTLEALAIAIDAKDQTGHNHIPRVQIYARGLARAVGMSQSEIEGLNMAALLHDIGKLAVPEHILAKPGPLTAEEFQKVRIHPQVGAGIIGSVPFPYPVAPLILNHHERWDGRGYPAGLKGADIPLGARVLSLADYFDALTSERPYHQAMSVDNAVGLLQSEAGKALDPHLVETFLQLLPTLLAEAQAAASTQPDAFDDIACAHREIFALYQIAQTMGTSLGVADTMAVISSKLNELVPLSACALFLHSEATDTLHCRFATGVDADILSGLSVRNGVGLTGWVGRNRRALLNARPAADLEAAGVDQSTVSSRRSSVPSSPTTGSSAPSRSITPSRTTTATTIDG